MRQLHSTRRTKEFRDLEDQLQFGTRKYNPELPVIAVDFDGTLVFNEYPFIENPNYELINFIKANKDRFTWILWTCRHGLQLKYAVDYMKDEHGIEFNFVNENLPHHIETYGDCRKIWANYYLDDKNADIYFLLKKYPKQIQS